MIAPLIVVLLHYDMTSAEDFPDIDGDGGAQWLIDRGLLEAARSRPSEPRYRITPAGRAYVEALCSVPLPVRCWKIGNDYYDEDGR